MVAEDRLRWDRYFRQRAGTNYPAPDPLLLQYAPPAAPEGRALDLAAGLGQNGLWLASQGYAVDIMDISRVALTRARQEMAARNLRNVNLLQVDVDETQIEAKRYALVAVFFYLKRYLFPQIRDSILPGGRIVYSTYNRQYLTLQPRFNPEYLLDAGELLSYFSGWKVLHDSEDDHISQIVAVKPT